MHRYSDSKKWLGVNLELKSYIRRLIKLSFGQGGTKFEGRYSHPSVPMAGDWFRSPHRYQTPRMLKSLNQPSVSMDTEPADTQGHLCILFLYLLLLTRFPPK